ncbi:MAG: glycosyltransferase family 1 protein [Armatimonadota bacterium]|nr:glycosyltransferase family 1 protein [Armatimonadota bacterium]MDR7450406.1 glycosyltransferase family 1 protein [Armatimonadota bacterium]MDR7467011.1 glycosyltransferase family 1 protein [Armatimonadota bacterium]MDR7493447.1 glycosyltransferase family 1 protein [Armatimonadota bacterium]MDR7498712.1 glycosyltransferase family 1 protein [Armatimonadota bacterium]
MAATSSVLVDARWLGPHGIGRFAAELLARFPRVDLLRNGLRPNNPVDSLVLSWVLRRRRSGVFFSPGYNSPLDSPVPFVFTIHDLIHIRFPEEITATKKAYYWTFVRPAVRRAACVLTVSEFSRREIHDWAGDDSARVVVVPPAASAAFTPEGERREPGYPYLLYVGNRKPHKNLKRCFQAIAQASLPHEMRLVMSGTADAVTAAEARRAGIAERLVFAGWVDDAGLATWYRGAVALVIPSLYEGFGLPALEAMASGTAVVASGTTALPEVVGDAAVMVDPFDVSSIAAGIERVVHDPDLRDELRRRGLTRAALFDWNRTARRVWEILSRAGEESI